VWCSNRSGSRQQETTARRSPSTTSPARTYLLARPSLRGCHKTRGPPFTKIRAGWSWRARALLDSTTNERSRANRDLDRDELDVVRLARLQNLVGTVRYGDEIVRSSRLVGRNDDVRRSRIREPSGKREDRA